MDIAQKKFLRKVPEVTALFWVTKLLTTAMGEATSDFFANAYNPYIVVSVSALVLAVVLLVQFRAKKYVPWIYWSAVAMVAVFGTMAADVLHKQFGVAYSVSTAFFTVVLAAVFSLWYKVEGTLSIHTVTTSRRELFYWMTVMATFALGTAAGDWTAYTLGLGYLVSGLIFLGLLAIPAIGYKVGLNEVLAFWFAYIVTRPVGASFADWFGKPSAVTGLGYGDGRVSIILAVLIVICVITMSFNRTEIRLERDGSQNEKR